MSYVLYERRIINQIVNFLNLLPSGGGVIYKNMSATKNASA